MFDSAIGGRTNGEKEKLTRFVRIKIVVGTDDQQATSQRMLVAISFRRTDKASISVVQPVRCQQLKRAMGCILWRQRQPYLVKSTLINKPIDDRSAVSKNQVGVLMIGVGQGGKAPKPLMRDSPEDCVSPEGSEAVPATETLPKSSIGSDARTSPKQKANDITTPRMTMLGRQLYKHIA